MVAGAGFPAKGGPTGVYPPVAEVMSPMSYSAEGGLHPTIRASLRPYPTD